MNKKIKVIDLLNKIAKGEELPKRIKVKESIFEWVNIEEGEGYHNTKKGDWNIWLQDMISLDTNEDLNETVEILEEIEELDEEWTYIEGQIEKTWSKSELELVNKINEFIRYIKRKDKTND